MPRRTSYDRYDDPEPRRPSRRPPSQNLLDEYEDEYEGDNEDEYEDGYEDDLEDDYEDDYDDYEDEPPQRAPPRRAPPRRAPAAVPAPRRSPRDQQMYERYQRSRSPARTGTGRGRPPGGQQRSHREAVEAYRRRKAEQGIATSSNQPVRVAKRAPQRDMGFRRVPKRKRSKGAVVKAVVLCVILLVVFLIPMVSARMPEVRDVLMSDLTEPAPRLFPVSAEYHLERQFNLAVTTGTVSYTLKVPIPYDIEGGQEIIEFSASPQGAQSGSEMRWSGDTSSGVTIVVSYYFKATTQKWSITSEISGTTKDVPGSYQKYLGDEWKIKPSNSEIRTLANEIMGDYDTVYEKLDALASWMRTNILYEKQRGWQPKDPLETLSDGTGDCDDQSILFASLARAQGIPVWLEMGALYDQYQKAWGGHAWLRAFVPLRTGGGMKVNMDPANKEFLVRDPFRITEWEADGNGTHLKDYYTLWSFSYSGYALYDAGAEYVDTGFKRSTDTVSDKPAGSGIQAWQDSFRVPGFEFLIVVPAFGIGSLYLRRRIRTVSK